MVLILLYTFLSGLFCLSFWLGYLRKLRIEHLNRSFIVTVFWSSFILITLLIFTHWSGLITPTFAARLTMGIYGMASGFFLGWGSKLFHLRKKSGVLEYAYHSFGTVIAPNIVILALILFGIYRTGLPSWQFSGVGITSGLSLIGFGFWGWTVSIVPQFKTKGILFLDQFIKWKDVTSYQWCTENSLQVEYYNSKNKLTDFRTYIPPDDHIVITRLLNEKITEYERRRHDVQEVQKEERLNTD